MTKIVGLTGGVASGKSTVARLFQHFEAPLVDADDIARQIVEPGMQAHTEIVSHFGKSILNQDNSLNRQALRQIVFDDPEQRHTLEQITHPIIRQEIIHSIEKYLDADYVIVDIPLLVEKGYQSMCDFIVVVDCSAQQQLERVTRRDDISPEDATKIISAQIDREERLKYATHVIHNTQSIDSLTEQVRSLHQQFKNA